MLKIVLMQYSFAAGSLHTTKGFGGYKPSTCLPGSSFRFLGPSVRIAVPLTILWGAACSFLTALVIQTTRTLTTLPNIDIYDSLYTAQKDLTILALVELGLSIITLSAVVFLLRIDCKYDPDWSEPPANPQGTGIAVIGGTSGYSLQPGTSGVNDRVTRVAWIV